MYTGSRSHKTNHPWHWPHMSPIVIVDHLQQKESKSKLVIILVLQTVVLPKVLKVI